jgi:hypothetical protein
MNTKPIDHKVTGPDVTLQDSLNPLHKTPPATPSPEAGFDVAPPADTSTEGWYEP